MQKDSYYPFEAEEQLRGLDLVDNKTIKSLQ